MFTKILVGYDGSKGGRAALERAAALARESKGELTALWVRQPLPRHADMPGESEGEAEAARDYFEERKREVEELAKRFGIAIGCETRAGHAAKVIVTFATDGGYDLIVVGHSDEVVAAVGGEGDRKSTRLNSSHQIISYAVFCLKKKKNKKY